MSDTAIRARGLSKCYGDVRALEGLSLTVEAGAFFGLLSPDEVGVDIVQKGDQLLNTPAGVSISRERLGQ